MCPATRRAPILGDWGRGGGRSQPWVLSPVGAGWGQKGHKRAWPPLETAPGEGGSLLPKPQPQVSPCALCTPGVAICPAVGPCPSLTPVRPWPRLGCVLPRLRLGPASKGAPLCPARPHLPAPCSLPSVPSQARVSRVRPQAFSGTGISDLLRGPSFPFLTNPVSCVYPAALRRKLPQAVGGRVPQGRGPQWSGPTSSGAIGDLGEGLVGQEGPEATDRPGACNKGTRTGQDSGQTAAEETPARLGWQGRGRGPAGQGREGARPSPEAAGPDSAPSRWVVSRVPGLRPRWVQCCWGSQAGAQACTSGTLL